MYAFDYKKAQSVDAASAALLDRADGKLLAGGMTLLPSLKLRLSAPTQLVDLGGIAAIKGIALDAKTLTIKSMTTHVTVANSADVKSAIPALATLASEIGDTQVRNRGTIGGSIANNDPAADYPAGCLGLGATIVTNRRELEAEAFFTGLFQTALEDGEVITAVRFPRPDKAAYIKFKNPASRFALVGIMVSRGPKGMRIAVTGAGDNGVFRVTAMEAALTKSFSPAAIDKIKVSPDTLMSDIHASAEYRSHLISVLAKRAVAACA